MLVQIREPLRTVRIAERSQRCLTGDQEDLRRVSLEVRGELIGKSLLQCDGRGEQSLECLLVGKSPGELALLRVGGMPRTCLGCAPDVIAGERLPGSGILQSRLIE